MSRVQEPLKLPKHPSLLEEINETIIGIKIYHTVLDASPEQIEAAKSRTKEPSWTDIIDLLQRSYKAINEQREDPRKY